MELGQNARDSSFFFSLFLFFLFSVSKEIEGVKKRGKYVNASDKM
jgi:hypothetical protein